MTREENLHWLNQEIQTWENECQSKHPIKEALCAARKALEQEPCEDAVSRKAVRDTIFAECAGTKLDIDFAKVLLLQRAIRALPPVTPQEPNTWSLDDAREDFMYDVYNILDFLPTNEEANRIIDIFDRVTSGIGQEPKKGHWIEKWDSDHLVILAYECSECGMMMNVNTFHYCPNCRADMREVKE